MRQRLVPLRDHRILARPHPHTRESGETPIVAAVETTPEGKPIRLKLRRVKGFRRAEIATLAQRNFQPASTVVRDGLHFFTGVGTFDPHIKVVYTL